MRWKDFPAVEWDRSNGVVAAVTWLEVRFLALNGGGVAIAGDGGSSDAFEADEDGALVTEFLLGVEELSEFRADPGVYADEFDLLNSIVPKSRFSGTIY